MEKAFGRSRTSKPIPNAVYTSAAPHRSRARRYIRVVFIQRSFSFLPPLSVLMLQHSSQHREKSTQCYKWLPKYVKWQNAIKGTKKKTLRRFSFFEVSDLAQSFMQPQFYFLNRIANSVFLLDKFGVPSTRMMWMMQ